MTKKVNFKIEHMDPLGQGVSKTGEKVTFIPKTLPGEEGITEIVKESKGVRFGRALKIEKLSESRIESVCPHFDKCGGCHYLHTDYETEISFKKSSLARDFSRFESIPSIEVISAPKRLHYRNRIQLHYNLKANAIGFKEVRGQKICDVSSCQIFSKDLQEIFDETLLNWKEIVKSQPPKGHIELYSGPSGVKRSVNKEYSDGGFSQVFEDMNKKAKFEIENYLNQHLEKSDVIIDLFGGAGNLSQIFKDQSVWVIDQYPEDKSAEHQSFHSLNLYDENSLEALAELVPERNIKAMIVDPPRSGLKNLNQFIEKFNPEIIVYLSCKPSTMSRDLLSISNQNWKVEKVTLLDFFPASFHYEGLMILKR
ncbi:MAG: class I SAM-dependent RNA methyltransferase [Bacteriovoracaceae bacterium]|nr:class I SAM-dependent RNA methyltransferase [Bacteriovoracaceae bacterium]